MRSIRPALFVLTTLLGASTPVLAGSSNPLYLNTVKATVMIRTPNGGGTGWVVSKARKQIITAQHVVEHREKVQIVFPTWANRKVVTDRSKYDKVASCQGRVVKADKVRDLALIEVDELPSEVTELKLADALPESGDDVHSVGCPGSSTGLWVYSYGRVRQVTAFDPQVKISRAAVQVVETQVPINPGDSGGPLVNDKGEVVGVNRSVHIGSALVSLSVAMTEVKAFLTEPVPEKKDDAASKPKTPRGEDDKDGNGLSPETRRNQNKGFKD